jgi:hydroxymethylbilane synthase
MHPALQLPGAGLLYQKAGQKQMAPEPRQSSAQTVRLGTRGSELALAQAGELRERLIQARPDLSLAVEIVVIATTGDKVVDRPLAEIGGKGLFTLEIEKQLADGGIDAAVHSTKDMPTRLPEGLELSCFLPRQSVADAFISNVAESIGGLDKGARVGTSSLRRKALIRRMRSDLEVVDFRGNVQTRLAKIDNGAADATILAEAGLIRLGLQHRAASILDIDRFPPAPGQGAICVETRIGDDRMQRLLAAVHHRETGIAIACERAYLAALDGSCRTPIAGHAAISGGSIAFHGMILATDGSLVHETRVEGSPHDAAAIGTEAAARLRQQAGERFFSDWAE